MREQTRFGRLLHGGDYNPEQWLDRPDLLEKDIEYLLRAGCNTVTMGMFSWAALEPEEGRFTFGWLEDAVGRLYENGISTILGTPSGARPVWMAKKYPEVLRVDENRLRNLYGGRHNHCPTSPLYREKVAHINGELARRFAGHPGVILWHLSNEYIGECHCELCQNAFRDWLQGRYGDIETLNKAWWTAFWSHTCGSFADIESPSPRGEQDLNGLKLAWRRFVSHQTLDFMKHEKAALLTGHPPKPVTTNTTYRNPFLNYHQFGPELDILSWDSYPTWGKRPFADTAEDTAFWHDVIRSVKGKPFLLMESCTTATNWQAAGKLKPPGLLEAASLQAVAHGADSVLYFQIRQSRGASEKFHGALIDHYGGDDTRVFKEAAHTGVALEALTALAGAATPAQVAVVHDWENQWAMEGAQGPRNSGLHYEQALLKNHRAFRRLGLDVDVPDVEKDLSGYKIVAAPMLYMLRAGFAEKIRRFVEGGGTFVLTYWSGIVDGDDLCFLGPTPGGGLSEVFGLRRQEIDALYDGQYNTLLAEAAAQGLKGSYTCEHLCDLVQPTTAQTLMRYGQDFYAGSPALTCNAYGGGRAYYLCADAEQTLYDDLFAILAAQAGLNAAPLPEGLVANRRVDVDSGREYLFLQNFGESPADIAALTQGCTPLYGEPTGQVLPPLGTAVFLRG